MAGMNHRGQNTGSTTMSSQSNSSNDGNWMNVGVPENSPRLTGGMQNSAQHPDGSGQRGFMQSSGVQYGNPVAAQYQQASQSPTYRTSQSSVSQNIQQQHGASTPQYVASPATSGSSTPGSTVGQQNSGSTYRQSSNFHSSVGSPFGALSSGLGQFSRSCTSGTSLGSGQGGPGTSQAGFGSGLSALSSLQAGFGGGPSESGSSQTGFGTGQNRTGSSQTGFGGGQSGSGSSQTGFGNVQSGAGSSQTGFGSGQSLPGSSQTGFGSGQGGPGSSQTGFGSGQGGPGSSPAGFGSGQSGLGSSQAGFGSGQGGPGSSQTGFGSGQGGPGSSPAGFGSGQSGPGSSQAGFGSGQSRPGSSQTGFGSGQGGPGSSQTGFGSGHGGPGSSRTSFGSGQGGPGTSQDGFGTGQSRPGSSPAGFGSGQSGPGSSQAGFLSGQSGPGSSQAGFGSSQGGPGSSQTGFGSGQGGPGSAQAGFGMRLGGPGSSQAGFGVGGGSTGGSASGGHGLGLGGQSKNLASAAAAAFGHAGGSHPMMGINAQHMNRMEQGLRRHSAAFRRSAEHRMFEFNKRLQQHTAESDNCWWDAFTTEFFEDDANLTIMFCMEEQPKRYTIGRTLIPRFFRSIYDSGVTELYFQLRHAKEAFHNTSITLDCEQCTLITEYGKPFYTKVCADVRLVLDFVYDDYMRIKSWHMTIKGHQELIPRSVIGSAHPSDSMHLHQISKNITRAGITNSTLNFLRLCVILEPMQELMSRHKAAAASPRDCLKTTLIQKFQEMNTPSASKKDAPPAASKGRKRKVPNAPGAATTTATGRKRSPTVPDFTMPLNDLMVAGEPTMMGAKRPAKKKATAKKMKGI